MYNYKKWTHQYAFPVYTFIEITDKGMELYRQLEADETTFSKIKKGI